jgi:Tfp pilus assembly protein PilN
MADLRVEVFLLKMKIEEQTLKIKVLQEKNCELEKQLHNCEEFEQKLISYLLDGANKQDLLQKELDELKLLCLQTDLQKRK